MKSIKFVTKVMCLILNEPIRFKSHTILGMLTETGQSIQTLHVVWTPDISVFKSCIFRFQIFNTIGQVYTYTNLISKFSCYTICSLPVISRTLMLHGWLMWCSSLSTPTTAFQCSRHFTRQGFSLNPSPPWRLEESGTQWLTRLCTLHVCILPHL